MSKHDLLVVAGAGVFIGGHLVKKLREDGFKKIRAVDQKPISEWYAVFHWEPSTRLRVGMEQTYRWIYDQMAAREPALNAV